jgi:hypothetical protein
MNTIVSTSEEFNFHEKGFNHILLKINECYQKWINKIKYIKNVNHVNYDVEADFTPCCSFREKEALKKAIQIVLRNTPDVYEKDGKTINYETVVRVYKAVLLYYYQTQVLEYYINQGPRFANTCYEEIIDGDKKLIELLDTLIKGDAPWNSGVRRLILGFSDVPEWTGGKKTKTKTKKHKRVKKGKTKRLISKKK